MTINTIPKPISREALIHQQQLGPQKSGTIIDSAVNYLTAPSVYLSLNEALNNAKYDETIRAVTIDIVVFATLKELCHYKEITLAAIESHANWRKLVDYYSQPEVGYAVSLAQKSETMFTIKLSWQ